MDKPSTKYFQMDANIERMLSCDYYKFLDLVNGIFLSNGFKEDVIDRIRHSDISVLDLSMDPHTLGIRTALNERGLYGKIIYLTCDFHAANGDDVIFMPSLLYYRSITYSKKIIHDQYTRSNKVSCLNRIPRGHKFYTYASLLEKPYANEVVLSFNGIKDSNSGLSISYDNPWYFDLPPSIHERYRGTNLYKESYPHDNTWGNDMSMEHPAFTDTYLNICTETSSIIPFYSEKICKPLAAGQFFLMVGNRNNLDALRSLGVDCYDDIFDNHSYEQHDSYIDRIDSMMKLLDEKYDVIEELHHSSYSRIQDTQRYFLSESFRQKMLDPLRNVGILNK